MSVPSNSWMLVGSVNALTATDYGRLLSLKILLFIAMLATAAVNRLVLTPHLMRAQPGTARVPLHHLRNTSALETVLGAAILIIVGALGTLPPGIEELQ
jgi:putative copper resistance protein D